MLDYIGNNSPAAELGMQKPSRGQVFNFRPLWWWRSATQSSAKTLIEKRQETLLLKFGKVLIFYRSEATP